eukprot:COSAG02_NODE_2399_length_8948_cov_21.873771_7_plen_474_part_00
MELAWNAEENPKAIKLLEECGWTVGGSDATVTVSAHAGGGWEVTTGGGSTSRVCTTIAETMAYINEDILQQRDGTIQGEIQPELDLFEGCMVGIAIGDMVGLGVENFDMPTCTKYTAELRPQGGLTKTMGPWELAAKQGLAAKNKEEGKPDDQGFVPATLTDAGSLRFPYGQISDDTQCSRELADSIIAAGRFSVQSFTEKLVGLHSTVGVIGQGPTSRATLDALQEGASWFEGSDAKPDALTNGSIMRVGPIGLLAWRNPTSPSAWANGVLSSHVTHQAPLCKEACAALGVAVAAAVRAKTRGEDPVTTVLDALGKTCPYTDYRTMLSAMLEAGPELQPAVGAMHRVVPQSDLFKTQGYDFADKFFHGEVTMFPPHSAGFAIYGFLRTPDDFWESILACIEVGGDTDSVASMCGSVAGAYAGYEAIATARPDAKFVLDSIQDTASPGTADVAALRAMGRRMYHVAVGPAPKL